MDIPKHLLNERYDDRYFDVVDALTEARHIHIAGGRVIERLAEKKRFRIGELGFGAGRILVALMESLEANGVFGVEIDYNSVDLYPVSVEKMGCLLEDFRDRAGRHIDKLTEAYSQFDISKPGWHGGVIRGSFGVVNLRLFVGEALGMAVSLDGVCDAWFLDGHAPAKNPDIWRAELLAAAGAKSAAGTTVTTFTVAGDVRRNLEAAGFRVEKVPGHGGKREALSGIFL